jgi:hypothetical protein
MTAERTEQGWEIETALGEVLAHGRGETELPCRIADDPAAGRIVALRKRFRPSRQEFRRPLRSRCPRASGVGAGARVPDRAAPVLLTVMDRNPEAVVKALGQDGNSGQREHSLAS